MKYGVFESGIYFPSFDIVVDAAGNSGFDNETCKKTKDTNLCLSTLRLDTRSSTVDAKGLAGIVLDITLKKAKDNLAQIDGLLSRTTDPALKDILSICLQEYGDATVVILPRAIQILESKSYAEAMGNAEDSARCAETCEESFSNGPRAEQNRPPTFTDQNNAVLHLSRLVQDIIVSFSPKPKFPKANWRPPHESAMASPKFHSSFMSVMPLILIL